MPWLTGSPQIHSTFASLGVRHGDTYSVSDDCLSVLEEILRKLAIEDQTLRTFRRAIGFGEIIKKDLIPLLIFVKDDKQITDSTKIIDTTIKILVNLTIPVECLLSMEAVSRTDIGRHTIFELNRLLTTSKEAFTDSRSTKAVVDHIKHVVEKDAILNIQQCDSINNCLLLLRNILHIPDNRPISNCPLAHASMQNEIIWNLFTQSIDKIIIYLMSCPQKMYWGVTMVQLIALMYKDQHVGTMQKLLNLWLETSMSDSSEDNESNTSPPERGSGESSPIVTSDPTSDSSDNGGSCLSNDRNKNTSVVENLRNKSKTSEVVRAVQNRNKALVGMKRGKSTETDGSSSSGMSSMKQQSIESNEFKKTPQLSQESLVSSIEKSDETSVSTQPQNITGITKRECPSSQSEVSDCGYGTQVENQESVSTSSNDDDQPSQKPVHQKPHTFQKSRYNNQKNRATTVLEKKELRRKKLVKRSKSNIINMKGLMHHTPTEEDISNILKEFTVDFLLKGYGSLVHDLYAQLLTNIQVQIDTSHFFWLVTYFLKFATQLELDFEHVSSVLTYDIIAYLVFQGIWLYEEFEMTSKIPDVDLKPCLRRLHLVVTAIREFLQAIETYLKLCHVSDEDRTELLQLQKQISNTEDLKYLFLLFLRQYNPKLQSRQYLQDLIVTNHNYLLFLDNVTKNEKSSRNIMEHLKQFATVEIMKQYGLLLEDFKNNGEFVNNCIFTMMHHIGGDLEHVSTLFQPSILKTFSQILETDYEICDDWSDLIEYVIHKFINTPRSNPCSNNSSPLNLSMQDKKISTHAISSSTGSDNIWSEDEKDNLVGFYNESINTSDTIANIQNLYKQKSGILKSEYSIIKELLEQNIISRSQYKSYLNIVHPNDTEKSPIPPVPKFDNYHVNRETLINGDIKVLKEYLFKENRGRLILWLQKIVIEACYVKLFLNNADVNKLGKYIMEPSVYYYALLNLPIPIIPWRSEEEGVLKHQPFILLIRKLGFHLPSDTGTIFVRIPNFWTADELFSIAQQLGPIDRATLKFDISLLEGIYKSELKNEVNDTTAESLSQYKFSMVDSRRTPAIVRYTPQPNPSSEWVQSIVQTKICSVMNTMSRIPNNNELSISIPDIRPISCDLPAPKLSIVGHPSSLTHLLGPLDMDISPTQEHSNLSDDIEQNSTYETASVASDLTRMFVSDEEDKVEL